MSGEVIPAVIRGRIIDDHVVEVSGRGTAPTFRTPSAAALLDQLPMRDPAGLDGLHAMPFEDIVDFLVDVGRHLDIEKNVHLQEALQTGERWSDYTPPVLRTAFRQLPEMFSRDVICEIADRSIGIPYLQGWVTQPMGDGRRASVRAFGTRSVHIIAGNSPIIAALTVIRNAITRSDAIIKSPSNDPLTALALARTMVEIAPNHPLTSHLSVLYWKGGDEDVENVLYSPANVEKIVAWGGLASVTHVTKFIRPGIELVTLDPKRSATIVDCAGLSAEDRTEVARRVATDVGALNQLGCVNARVVYLGSGLDADGLKQANEFGEEVYRQLLTLPEEVSTKAKMFDGSLRSEIAGLRFDDEWYRVIGGLDDEGAVIVSQMDEPVPFSRSLSGRVVNIVPLERVEDAVHRVDASTQTIGVYPEQVKDELRDALALRGAQRIVSLGFAASPNPALPQDAIEPVRRMVKWVVVEDCDSAIVPSFLSMGRPPADGAQPDAAVR